MHKFAVLLRSTLMGLLLVSIQACTQEVPAPTAISTSSSSAATLLGSATSKSKGHPIKGDSIKVRKQAVQVGKPSGTGSRTSLMDGQCYQIQDVYYNLYTGEIVDIVNLGTFCYNSGSGGGGNGGGTGGGGGGGGGDGGTGTGLGPDGRPYAIDGPLTIGDTSKLMIYPYNATTDLVVLLEFTADTHVVDKVSVISVGTILGTTFAQVGNGIASYVSAHDMYNFSVTGQFSAVSPQTGPIQNLAPVTLTGTYYAATDTYRIAKKP